MLLLDNVSVSYGEKAVFSNLNLCFAKEKIHAVLGKSGGGKSSLLHVLAGIKSYTGSVLLNGEILNQTQHRVAMVPQKNSLVPWKTARQNICLPSTLRRHTEVVFVEKLAEELGISHILDKYPNHISGGEQQRVAIARALLFNPDLLLLDEAFSALDVITKSEVQRIFFNAICKHSTSTILVTHDINEALYLANEIYVLKNGNCSRVIEQNNLFGRDPELFPMEYHEMACTLKEQI